MSNCMMPFFHYERHVFEHSMCVFIAKSSITLTVAQFSLN